MSICGVLLFQQNRNKHKSSVFHGTTSPRDLQGEAKLTKRRFVFLQFSKGLIIKLKKQKGGTNESKKKGRSEKINKQWRRKLCFTFLAEWGSFAWIPYNPFIESLTFTYSHFITKLSLSCVTNAKIRKELVNVITQTSASLRGIT